MNGDWPGDDPFEHPGLGADHLGGDPLGTEDLVADHLGADHFDTGGPGTDHLGLHDLGPDDLGLDDLGPGHLGTGHLGTDDPGAGDPGADGSDAAGQPYDHDPAHHDYLAAGEHPYAAELVLEHEPPTDVAPAEVGPFEGHPVPTGPEHLDALPQHIDTSPFPAHLEVDVTPADGRDWVDPYLLGEPEGAFAPDIDVDGALHHLQAAEGADPARSEDPAIRALALFWGG
jgi:hypothetical protein